MPSEARALAINDGATQIRRWGLLPMLERCRDLGWDILKQTAATGDVHGLHASADAEQGDIGLPRQVDHVQFKIRATFAYSSKGIALTFTVQ